MRTFVSVILGVVLLGCSGREPPVVSRFDAAGYFPDNGIPPYDAVLDPNDVPQDVAMIPEGVVVPDWSLPDQNPASRTHNQEISPSGLRPKVTAYYFSNAI
ncbi:MAG: hypothetical protein R3A48_14300 [Polyangiales bacterium]